MRTSNGRYRWSIRRTISPSSQTVRSSRAVPSTTTRTCVLLGFPQGGEEAREARTAQFSLHVPREGVVVGHLLFHLREFLVESAALFVDRAHGVEQTLLALPPPVELLLGRFDSVGHLIAPGRLAERSSVRGCLLLGWREDDRTRRLSFGPCRAPSRARLCDGSAGGSSLGSACGAPAISSAPRVRARRSTDPSCSGSTRSRLYNRNARGLLLPDLHAGHNVLEQVKDVERLPHEILRDALARVEAEDEFQVVDLPHADELRDGPLRRGLSHVDLSDQVLPLAVRGELDDVSSPFQLLFRNLHHLRLGFLRHRRGLRGTPSRLAVIKALRRLRRSALFDGDLYRGLLCAAPRARGLAVMTSLSHSEGHRFESGRAHS